MTQREINEREWRDRSNWSDSVVGLYFSKKDSRTWVPKTIPWMGWTLNLAQPAGARWLLGILVGIPMLMIFLLVFISTVAGKG